MQIVESGHYPCIYQIRNLINGKVYVGSAVDYAKRCFQHNNVLSQGKHHSRHLQLSYDKHGSDNFVIEPLERTDKNKDILFDREQFWIDEFKSYETGYNIRPCAKSNLGMKYSDETKDRIRKAITGIKRSDETKEKLAASKRGTKRTPESIAKAVATMTGRHHSEETKRKIGEGNKGKVPVVTDKMRETTRRVHTGKVVSKETRKKMSIASKSRLHIGHPMSEENKAKLIASRKGIPGTPWTEERRQKESIRMTGNIPGNKSVPITEATRKKISGGLKVYYLTHKKIISAEQKQKISDAAKRRHSHV